MTLDGYDPLKEDDEESYLIGDELATNCQAYGPGIFGSEAGQQAQFVVQVIYFTFVSTLKLPSFLSSLRFSLPFVSLFPSFLAFLVSLVPSFSFCFHFVSRFVSTAFQFRFQSASTSLRFSLRFYFVVSTSLFLCCKDE
jgi:hypothetical protein